MDFVEKFKDQAPEMVKNNKGALIGAVIGYFLTDNKQAQSAILGAVAGSMLVDNNKDATNTSKKSATESER
jgi:hypothetical protein